MRGGCESGSGDRAARKDRRRGGRSLCELLGPATLHCPCCAADRPPPLRYATSGAQPSLTLGRSSGATRHLVSSPRTAAFTLASLRTSRDIHAPAFAACSSPLWPRSPHAAHPWTSPFGPACSGSRTVPAVLVDAGPSGHASSEAAVGRRLVKRRETWLMRAWFTALGASLAATRGGWQNSGSRSSSTVVRFPSGRTPVLQRGSVGRTRLILNAWPDGTTTAPHCT